MIQIFEDTFVEIYRVRISDDVRCMLKAKGYDAFASFSEPKTFENYMSQLQGAYDQLCDLVESGKAPPR